MMTKFDLEEGHKVEKVDVEYFLGAGAITSAWLIISSPGGNYFEEHLINLESTQMVLDLPTLQTGIYSVSLVVDGSVCDGLTFSKL